MLNNPQRWLVIALGLLLLCGSASAQSWQQSKSCSVQAMSVYQSWQTYFTDNPNFIITYSVNHRSSQYGACFLEIHLWYLEGFGDRTPGAEAEDLFLLQLTPFGWYYVAVWTASPDYACSVGNITAPCTEAYEIIQDRMQH